MGFESFRVELRGGPTKHSEADEMLRKLPSVKLDQQSISMPGSTYYIVEDGLHVIELELMDSPVRISCRFTLCHPLSVDAAFLGLVRELMTKLGMEACLREDVLPKHSGMFSLDDFARFSAITANYIAERRKEWIATFGTQQIAATTREVHARIILPRCQPFVEQPK